MLWVDKARPTRVGFFQPVAIDDGYGNVTSGFADEPDFDTYAEILDKAGGETVQAARLTGRNLANITVRSYSRTREVTTSWLAKDMRYGTIYNIRSIIDPNGKRRLIEMLCETGVAA